MLSSSRNRHCLHRHNNLASLIGTQTGAGSHGKFKAVCARSICHFAFNPSTARNEEHLIHHHFLLCLRMVQSGRAGKDIVFTCHLLEILEDIQCGCVHNRAFAIVQETLRFFIANRTVNRREQTPLQVRRIKTLIGKQVNALFFCLGTQFKHLIPRGRHFPAILLEKRLVVNQPCGRTIEGCLIDFAIPIGCTIVGRKQAVHNLVRQLIIAIIAGAFKDIGNVQQAFLNDQVPNNTVGSTIQHEKVRYIASYHLGTDRVANRWADLHVNLHPRIVGLKGFNHRIPVISTISAFKYGNVQLLGFLCSCNANAHQNAKTEHQAKNHLQASLHRQTSTLQLTLFFIILIIVCSALKINEHY